MGPWRCGHAKVNRVVGPMVWVKLASPFKLALPSFRDALRIGFDETQ
jgi:hypothetical protein